MMLKTHLGPVESEEGMHYLRPETAQGIFVNFLNVLTTSRRKPPFGIGQIGKSFRNEITPGNFIFRTREFEQMEMEFFVEPGTRRGVAPVLDRRAHALVHRPRHQAGQPAALRAPAGEARRTTAKRTVDIEYRFQFGGQEWGELEGIANRTDFDLTTHTNHSGVDLSYFDQATNSRYRPFVIEPAAGVGRPMMAFLLDAYREDEAPNAKGGVDKRVGAQPRPQARAGEGRGAAAVAQPRPHPEGPRRRRRAAPALEHRLRRRGRHRPPLPPAGRDRHPVLRDRRLRLASATTRSPCGSATPWPRSGSSMDKLEAYLGGQLLGC